MVFYICFTELPVALFAGTLWRMNVKMFCLSHIIIFNSVQRMATS